MTWRPPANARPTDTFRAGRRLWSTADDALLRERYPHEPTAPLAGELRRSLVATYQRAQTLGLEKTEAYLASPAACRLRREATPASVATRFKKGQVPANKGLRRPGWAPGRMRETQFKRGARPQTWVPVGTVVVDPDGYRKQKVADERRPSRFNWRFVHVLVWETAHGPVPTGHAVTFRSLHLAKAHAAARRGQPDVRDSRGARRRQVEHRRGDGRGDVRRRPAVRRHRSGRQLVRAAIVGRRRPRPGLPIPIFGGKHGDVPLERGAGELLADLVVEKRLTCVLDLSRFESEADKKAFLLAFAQRLYLKNENPLHLFLEEADDYIPQKPMRDEAQLLRAWENIVRRGRARGLGMTLITQRSARSTRWS
jgi:hypothetical protein